VVATLVSTDATQWRKQLQAIVVQEQRDPVRGYPLRHKLEEPFDVMNREPDLPPRLEWTSKALGETSLPLI
jgi:hypothetical protein